MFLSSAPQCPCWVDIPKRGLTMQAYRAHGGSLPGIQPKILMLRPQATTPHRSASWNFLAPSLFECKNFTRL